MRIPPYVTAFAITVACSSQAIQNTSSGEVATRPTDQSCVALETRDANAPDQRPAFAGQTRACGIRNGTALDVTVVARGLDHPWSVEPLPGGDLLVTEKPGRLRIISASGVVSDPITGLPAVDARGQGGLLDVALSPGFATDRTIFWSFSEPRDGGNGTSVARAVLSADRKSLSNVQVIFRVLPAYNGTMHYGSRLAFAPDGSLLITTGERSDAQMRPYAQRLDSHLGKVMRIRPDGSSPSDNPFVSTPNAQPQVFSYGHRNIQAASVDTQGRLWIIEHGTNGGDELNLIEKGKNYGWPLQAYGIEYNGQPIQGSETQRPNMQQPVYYWDPVIAPSGMVFYTGNAFPEWRGSAFIGGLVDKSIVRVRIENERVTGIERIAHQRNQRVRDVQQGPDGFLYVVTDEENGEVWRVRPRR